jgi:hypothetical protein
MTAGPVLLLQGAVDPDDAVALDGAERGLEAPVDVLGAVFPAGILALEEMRWTPSVRPFSAFG